jgi:hypothetical protein
MQIAPLNWQLELLVMTFKSPVEMLYRSARLLQNCGVSEGRTTRPVQVDLATIPVVTPPDVVVGVAFATLTNKVGFEVV